jgi:hypothetical protein
VRDQASARRVAYAEKAKTDLEAFDVDLDVDDIRDCLCAALDDSIVGYEDDHTRPDKKVLKLKTVVAGKGCYCKVSLRVGWDRTVAVLSFKPWRE